MNDFSRRTFLKTSAAVAGTTAALGVPNIAMADGWGEIPSGVWDPGFEGVKVLEIFCYSGMSQWENFWVAEDAMGNPDWKNFENQVANMDWGCVGAPSPAAQTINFGNDAVGNSINWGPATKPLWRNDIFDRVRMVTVGHDLLPHEAASPLALTGRTLGNPRLSGLGAAIQHRAMDVNPREVPYSFVLSHDDLGLFNFIESPMIATGLHPGFSQPLLLRIGDGNFEDTLERSHMSDESDELIDIYNAQYRDRLRWLGVGDELRSSGYKSYDSAVKALLNADNLNALLGGNLLDVVDGPICATYPSSIANPVTSSASRPNKTATALNVAVHTLTAGDGKYACVIDRGVLSNGAANSPYDTHTNTRHAETNATNLFNLLSNLADHIDPTGADPTKINLDNTMIVINTEFGRAPSVEIPGAAEGNRGRNHHPYGYVSLMIGGPITTRGIVGTLDSNGFQTVGHDYSPTDVHGAAMLAAGVDPFSSENFGVTEFTSNVNDGTEQGTRINLKETILGVV